MKPGETLVVNCNSGLEKLLIKSLHFHMLQLYKHILIFLKNWEVFVKSSIVMHKSVTMCFSLPNFLQNKISDLRTFTYWHITTVVQQS